MTRRELLLGAVGTMALAGTANAEGKNLAERLGHSRTDRLVMFHADDVGMCHSANDATWKAMTEGVVTCGSVMVPCPWFPEAAARAREHPEADLGLHLTLTSEWSYYRWRPVAPPDQVKGLIDPDGFLWRKVEDVKKHATPAEVEVEIRAQIARARQFGMKPTHVDSHMGTLFADAGFFEAYVRVATETHLFPMLPRPTPETIEEGRQLGVDYVALTRKLEGGGYVLLDRLNTGLEGGSFEERKTDLLKFLKELKPGVTELIVHLAGDDPEIHNVTAAWQRRWHDFRLMTDPTVREALEKEGIKRVGYRELSRLWPVSAAS